MLDYSPALVISFNRNYLFQGPIFKEVTLWGENFKIQILGRHDLAHVPMGIIQLHNSISSASEGRRRQG